MTPLPSHRPRSGTEGGPTPRVQRALHVAVVADRAAVVAERDRYRQALDQAVDELMVGDTTTALSILQRALNQERDTA